MTKFKVIVSGSVYGTYNTREEAEQALTMARNSYLALVHPRDCFYIKEVKA